MSTNSRFKDLGNGLQSEMIAHQTQLMYNPTTQQASAIFNGSPYLYISGQYQTLGQDIDILRVDLTSKMIERVGNAGDVDPVTGADLSMISVAGQMILMKRAYDKFHNERAAQIAADIAAQEAAAAAAAAAPAEELPAAPSEPTGTTEPADNGGVNDPNPPSDEGTPVPTP